VLDILRCELFNLDAAMQPVPLPSVFPVPSPAATSLYCAPLYAAEEEAGRHGCVCAPILTTKAGQGIFDTHFLGVCHTCYWRTGTRAPLTAPRFGWRHAVLYRFAFSLLPTCIVFNPTALVGLDIVLRYSLQRCDGSSSGRIKDFLPFHLFPTTFCLLPVVAGRRHSRAFSLSLILRWYALARVRLVLCAVSWTL
jgi:hypothetical protein